MEDQFNVFLLKTRKEDEIKIEENTNVHEIKILEIRKNEHFGDALMFLNERCPLILKVRTKIAELLVLRKMEAIEIYSVYPNIWKRINKKSLFNMEQIKLKIKKELFFASRKYGSTKERKILKNSKSLRKYLNINLKPKKNKKNKSAKSKQKEKNEEKNKISNNENNKNNNSNNDTKEDESHKNNSRKEDIQNNGAINGNDEEASQKSSQNNRIIRIKDNSNNSNQENKNSENIIVDKVNSNKIENEKDDKNEEDDKKMSKNNNENIDSNALISNNSQKNNNNKVENKGKVVKDRFKNRLSLINFHAEKKSINNSNLSNNPSINTTNTKKFRISCINEEEKILFNSFTNLTTTNEKSFQLNSSYENLNEITKINILMIIIYSQKQSNFYIMNALNQILTLQRRIIYY